MQLLGRKKPSEAEAAPGRRAELDDQLDLGPLMALAPERDVWENIVGKVQDQFGGLRTRGGEGLVPQVAVDLGVQALKRFDGNNVWRRHAPQGAKADRVESYRVRLRLGFFFGVVIRYLAQELAGMRAEGRKGVWTPMVEQSFRSFYDACGGDVAVRYDPNQMHGGQSLLLAHALFGRRDVHERLGQEIAREVFVYLSLGGKDTLFGQIMGEAQDVEVVSADVAAMFLEVLRSDVESERLEINCNPADLFVFVGWVFLVYPAAFRKVLKHLRLSKGCEVPSRDGLILELIREGVLLTHEGYSWEVPEDSSWGLTISPPGVVMGEVLFPGNMNLARLRGLCIRQSSLWEKDPELTLFEGGIRVLEASGKGSVS